MAADRDGAVVQLASHTEVGLAHGAAVGATLAVLRLKDGRIDPRDAALEANLHLLDEEKVLWRVRPGVSLPLGSVGNELISVTPLSTGSVDPRIASDLVVGGLWLGSLSVVGRVPVYPGRDGRTQGALGDIGLRLARRMGRVVPWVGVAGVGQLADSRRENAYTELAATLGAAVSLHERWGIAAQGRLPLLGEPAPPYLGAVSASVTGVFGNPPDSHQH